MTEGQDSILDKIVVPGDLRGLKIEELPRVCEELRDFLVQALAGNPGHFASSLGCIELTVALHYVFNTPYDRIVWDVGHQAYAHKVLTGRRERFAETNRRFGGLHPFPCPAESEYDTFTAGHASNSISAALGMAVAAQQKGETDRHVVAVIGDGAMSGGLAFEGLNNLSACQNDLLVVLNDNDMSIDDSVGGMKQYLHRMQTSGTYNNVRDSLARRFYAWGLLNDKRRKTIVRFGNAVKSLINRRQNVWEGMDIRYFGISDGHNVIDLVHTLRVIKDMKGPKMLHINTEKGHGYAPAVADPTVWHAPGRFNPETGERVVAPTEGKPLKYQDVFGHTIIELAKANPRIVGVTPAMPTGCSLNLMAAEMPERVFDVGIAEGHAVTFSGGMAKDGLLPFCNIYSAFAQRAYDNIIHDVCIQHLNVVFCFDRAGIVGEDGETHHGAFDMAALRPIPGITICSPMDERELRHMMFTAQQPDRGPFVIRYPRGESEHTDWQCPMEELPIGRARLLTAIHAPENAETVAVLTIGPIGNVAARAIDRIKENSPVGIMHYDMRFLKPIDEDVLHLVASKCQRVVTVEDGARNGGLGTAVSEFMADHGYNVRVTRLGLPDAFVTHGTVSQLRHIAGIDEEAIADAVLENRE